MRLVTVIGARPQFVKAAPLSRAIAAAPGIEEIAIHTGQHFDYNMSDIFFEELRIPRPAHNLAIHGGGHGEMTARMLAAIETVLLDDRPDAMVVFGDTNSTLAGALAASKLEIPVVHIEAGLRSFNRAMPEEINRVLTDHISSLLMCPTKLAVANLEREGITRGVYATGDLMYDVTKALAPIAEERSTIRADLGLGDGPYGLATLHRAENTDTKEALRRARDFLLELSGTQPIVLPLHPRTKGALERHGLEPFSGGDMRVIDPVGYIDMLALLKGAALVCTDSGGLQKEAYFAGVPCVTMRSETEWVETITHGWNRLWSTENYQPRREIAEYGDGDSADKIVDIIGREFGL
ncbi:MAG: non-hydrolyzing UDP-N-acetylglucosamine 2-epimerase [Parvularculaceae bacterium]